MTDQSEETREYEFDVALSFAGEDRALVEKVIEELRSSNIRMFYDQDQSIESWGEDLVEYLTNAYQNRARYAIIFISQPYLEKMWTNLERRSVLARAAGQRSAYLLPVRLDDTPLPGLLPTLAYLDIRLLGADGLVEAIKSKIGPSTVAPTFSAAPAGKVPRTRHAIQELIAQRPPAWEYLLYGAVLLQELNGTETKYRDHLIGYSRPIGRYVRLEEVDEFIEQARNEALGIIQSFNRVLSHNAQEAAFGRPGEPGDPDRIVHLAERLISVYEDFIHWAARLRGTSAPSDSWRDAFDALAHFADGPINRIREFARNYVDQVDTFSGRLARGETIHLTMEVAIDVSPEHSLAFESAVKRATKAK
jgi:hypothetical protein